MDVTFQLMHRNAKGAVTTSVLQTKWPSTLPRKGEMVSFDEATNPTFVKVGFCTVNQVHWRHSTSDHQTLVTIHITPNDLDRPGM